MREMDGVHGRDYILHVSHDAASVGWGGEHATRESRCAELHLTSRRYTTLSNSTVKSDEINGAPKYVITMQMIMQIEILHSARCRSSTMQISMQIAMQMEAMQFSSQIYENLHQDVLQCRILHHSQCRSICINLHYHLHRILIECAGVVVCRLSAYPSFSVHDHRK